MRDITLTRPNEMFRRPWPNESHWKLYQEQLWVMPGCTSAQASHIRQATMPADSTQLDKVELLMPCSTASDLHAGETTRTTWHLWTVPGGWTQSHWIHLCSTVCWGKCMSHTCPSITANYLSSLWEDSQTGIFLLVEWLNVHMVNYPLISTIF